MGKSIKRSVSIRIICARQEKYPCPVLFSGHDTACRVSPASRARLYDFLKFPPPQKVSTSCSGFSAELMEALRR